MNDDVRNDVNFIPSDADTVLWTCVGSSTLTRTVGVIAGSGAEGGVVSVAPMGSAERKHQALDRLGGGQSQFKPSFWLTLSCTEITTFSRVFLRGLSVVTWA